MNTRTIFATVFGVIVGFCAAFGYLSSKEHHRIESGSLRILTSSNSGQGIRNKIQFNQDPFPYFYTEGETGAVDVAGIEIKSGNSISINHITGEVNSYVLYLFSADDKGNIIASFDLNCDGTWDTKKNQTLHQQYILLENNWVAVDIIAGLISKTPTATGGGKKYKFDGQHWVEALK